MKLVLITAPTADVVDVDDMKRHLRVDFGDDDELIEAYIAAAVDQLDAASGGWLGRALRPQTWELRLPYFPVGLVEGVYGAIRLPYPPLIEVLSVKYDDLDGVEHTLVADVDYRLLGFSAAAPPPNERAMIAPVFLRYWPATRYDAESVRIRFRCGYAPAVTEGDEAARHDDYLPPRINAWIKLVVGSLYENRESVIAVRGGRENVLQLPDHILAMLSTLRVY